MATSDRRERRAGTGTSLSEAALNESPSQIVERYDDWALDYADDVRTWGYTLPEDIASLVVKTNPVGTILDAGCGTGLIGRALIERGVSPSQLIGVDVSIASLQLAEASADYAAVIHGDLGETLPFDDQSLGAVVCGGVLSYLSNSESVIREFVRVVRTGGSVVVSQRTDLWVQRDFDELLARIRADGHRVEISDRVPYLPDLAEYGNEIEVIYATITRQD